MNQDIWTNPAFWQTAKVFVGLVFSMAVALLIGIAIAEWTLWANHFDDSPGVKR